MTKVAVQFAEGFEEIEAITIVDILRRAEINIQMVSVTSKLTVTGSHQIPIQTDCLISEVNYDDIDMVILPGGMPGTLNLKYSEVLMDILTDFNRKQKWIGAICAAPSILGEEGFLKNKKATSYPSVRNKLIDAIESDENSIIDQHLITSQGVGTAIDFSLQLVEIIKGKTKRDALAKEMLVD